MGGAALAGAVLLASGSGAWALTNCKASTRGSDGVILVKASTVNGQLKWGPAAGQETKIFFNAATCDKGTGYRARSTTAGAPAM